MPTNPEQQHQTQPDREALDAAARAHTEANFPPAKFDGTPEPHQQRSNPDVQDALKPDTKERKSRKGLKRTIAGVATVAVAAVGFGAYRVFGGSGEGSTPVTGTEPSISASGPSHESTAPSGAPSSSEAKPGTKAETYTGPSIAELKAMSPEKFSNEPLTVQLYYASQFYDDIAAKVTPANFPQYPDSVPNTHPSFEDSGQTYLNNESAVYQYLGYYMWNMVNHSDGTSTLTMNHADQYKVLSSGFVLTGENGSDNLRRVKNLYSFDADQNDRTTASGMTKALSTKVVESVTIEGIDGKVPAKEIQVHDSGDHTYDETIALVPYLKYNKANPNQAIPAKQWVSVKTVNQN